ncbi:MAG: hypothetical protein RI554_10805 [Trueperaceae bacterium]|nr:hypothetical protein [Trueperaceae bacterium]
MLLLLVPLALSVTMAQTFSASDTQTVSVGYTLGNNVDAPAGPIAISITNVSTPSTPSTDEQTIEYTFATSGTDLRAEITKVGDTDITTGTTSPQTVGLAADANNYFSVGIGNGSISSFNNGEDFVEVNVDTDATSDILDNYGQSATHNESIRFYLTRTGTGPGDNFDEPVEITFTVADGS